MNEYILPDHDIKVYWFYPAGHCISACMYYNTMCITGGVFFIVYMITLDQAVKIFKLLHE